MKRRLLLGLLVAFGMLVTLLATARPKHTRPAFEARYVEGGVEVHVEVAPVDAAREDLPLREGDLVRFRFRLTDAQSGAPFGKGFPVAWVDRQRNSDTMDDAGCRAKIRTFLEGNLFRRADVDLNEYAVLLLHDEPFISVIDPRFGFGGTKLLSLVSLESRGADWVLTDDQQTLFVSLPDTGKLALIDPVRFVVAGGVDIGGHPEKLVLQPDEGYLWVLDRGGNASRVGVTVVSVHEQTVLARFGAERGALAISADNRWAFLTQPNAHEILVIDVPNLVVERRIQTEARPMDVAYSRLARAAYVTFADRAELLAIDAARGQTIAHIATKPGMTGIAMAPEGRLGFVFGTESKEIDIIDTSSNHVIQSAELDGEPDGIFFSDTLVYVRQRSSENVLLVPLDGASVPGVPTPMGDFAGGAAPPGPAPAAATMTLAPGGGAMLVANATDKAVYYYKEGMAAPMGHFSTYGRAPRGVLVVDHSLREQTPGTYETTARLSAAGMNDIAFVLDSPRMAHCFQLDVAKRHADATTHHTLVELAASGQTLVVGQPTHVPLRLRDAETGEAQRADAEVDVLAYLSPGIWQTRLRATPREDGLLDVTLTPPKPGVYSIVLMTAASKGTPSKNVVTLMAE